MSKTLAAIILTKNESKHIVRCLQSLRGIADDVVVVDCGSTDDTCQLASQMGARVFVHPWRNYAQQFNFGIYECGIEADWIWRIDADEYLADGLGEAVKAYVQTAPEAVNGLYVRKRIDFMGKPLKHGGWYPCYHLKVWRRGHGECENRWMDEHIRLTDGTTVKIETGCQVDANLNDLSWWTDKHNGYASREVLDILLAEYGMDERSAEVESRFWGTEEQRKRWLKLRYQKLPLFIRPFLNFCYRYFLRAGFLDGKEGLVWHLLQGFWYRLLVDAKYFELKRSLGYDDARIKAYLLEHKK